MTHKPTVIPIESEEQWLAERQKYIGASDAADICGVGFGGPLGKWLEKRGETPPKTMNESMEMGLWFEDAIAKRFEHKTGWKVKPANYILVHPTHTFMSCSLDRWTEDESGDEIPLEIKNVSEYMADRWQDGPPDYYRIQVQHQLAVTGKPYAYIAACIGGNRVQWWKIERDDALIAAIIEIEAKFWELVQTGQPPAIDESEEAEQVLRLVYPESEQGKSITLDDDLTTTYRHLRQAQVSEDLIAAEIQGYKNKLLDAMKDAEAAYLPGQDKPVITYKSTPSRRLDIKRLSSDHPELVQPYYTETVQRRFLVKGEKVGD